MKIINYKKGFRYKPEQTDYTFRLKKRNWKWLWLLALLPLLLLFVRCEREIEVATVAQEDGSLIPNVQVKMEYTAHYLYKDNNFFKSEKICRTDTTDSNGKATFDHLGCSVFSYIFYCLQRSAFEIDDDCMALTPSPESCNFHYTHHKTLNLSPKKVPVVMETLDRETGEPVADALVVYSFVKGKKEITDSVRSDAAGKLEIKDVPKCGDLNVKNVSCYGYEDLRNVKRPVATIIADNDSAKLLLTPLKESFTYYVKNKYTKQPVPNASVEVTLTSKNGQTIGGKSTTNVDGKGRGAYKDAFVLAKVGLRASKQGFKDGTLAGDYTVAEFIKLPDSLRVVYLEPEASLHEFRNLDSISKKPIVGVHNHIVRKSIDGQTYDYPNEISNSNGVFTCLVIEDDELTITSEHSSYDTKYTKIDKFKKGIDILMKPRVADLKFRTIIAGTQTLLPDCRLVITDSEGNKYSPTNSGNGEFTVKSIPHDTEISIFASKSGYEDNDYTIDNIKVAYLLSASQNERDIPLEKEMMPCEGGATVAPSEEYHQRTYNMGVQSGQTTVYIDFDSAPDYITIYDGPDTSGKVLLNKGSYTEIHTFPINFTKGCITVVVEGTTRRDYIVHCPN